MEIKNAGEKLRLRKLVVDCFMAGDADGFNKATLELEQLLRSEGVPRRMAYGDSPEYHAKRRYRERKKKMNSLLQR